MKLLLLDILQQTVLPDHIVVVDGDPDSGEVKTMLGTLPATVSLLYLPSNHGNLPYQRYLGWRVAADLDADAIIYFDDDQRIFQHNVLEWLVRPLSEPSDVVGVGCYSRVPATGHNPAMDHLMNRDTNSPLVAHFGSQRNLGLGPGDLTPVGHRIGLVDNGEDYVETTWLQGRIMAYRMVVISQSIFSDDLFALDNIRCGLGEDTFLSRRVGGRGRLLYTFRAIVDHPNADTPKSYPYEAYKYAYAATYSRRFQNDYYRVYDPPTWGDRWALLKSYVGNVALSWGRVIAHRDKLHLALARGTTMGALHGITRPPKAQTLTPLIDWWQDANLALSRVKRMNQPDV